MDYLDSGSDHYGSDNSRGRGRKRGKGHDGAGHPGRGGSRMRVDSSGMPDIAWRDGACGRDAGGRDDGGDPRAPGGSEEDEEEDEDRLARAASRRAAPGDGVFHDYGRYAASASPPAPRAAQRENRRPPGSGPSARKETVEDAEAGYWEWREEAAARSTEKRRTAEDMVAPDYDENGRPKKKMLTDGLRKANRVLRASHTDEDTAWKVAHDTLGLVSLPVKHPARRVVDEVLGNELSAEVCFACSHGDKNWSAASAPKMREMRDLYLATKGTCSDWQLAYTLSAFYEKNIRGPANSCMPEGRAPLPRWPPRSVYDHFTEHIREPAAAIANMIDVNRMHMKQIVDHGLYKVPADMDPSKEIKQCDLAINPEYHKMLLQSMAMHMKLYSQNPKKMAFYNEGFTVEEALKKPFVVPKENMEVSLKNKAFLNINSLVR